MDPIREAVREKYATTAIRIRDGGACCDTGCCGGSDAASGPIGDAEYSMAEVADLGLSLGASLGCGNPTALAQLRPGDVVLDLGSGAGLDVLLSARRVSPGGRAYGVDMTDEMLALANENKARAGVENATFLKGTIEALPLPDASVDVVISNCVINLAPDKTAVLKEAFRVLRPGGRLAVSDMVEVEPLPAHVKSALDAWAGCVAGTIPIDAYRAALREVGFTAVEFEITNTFGSGEAGLPAGMGKIASAAIRASKPAESQTKRPEQFLCPGTGAPGIPPQVCTRLPDNGT
jgi:arsenite methyltransferase